MPIPDEETPLPRDSESLRDSIRKLSGQSERLKEAAQKNAREAEQITAQLKAIEKMLTASTKAKKTSGRIS
jgi:predicted ribosome quality control (RQC) complex YloA/Tae2 family protein